MINRSQPVNVENQSCGYEQTTTTVTAVATFKGLNRHLRVVVGPVFGPGLWDSRAQVLPTN